MAEYLKQGKRSFNTSFSETSGEKYWKFRYRRSVDLRETYIDAKSQDCGSLDIYGGKNNDSEDPLSRLATEEFTSHNRIFFLMYIFIDH